MKTSNMTFIMIFLLSGIVVYVQEAVSAENFIGVTEKVIDALDVVEAACDDPKVGIQEIEDDLKKLRKASEPYKRYDANAPNLDKEQEEIINAIEKAERSFKLFLFSVGCCYSSPTEDEILHAKEHANIARRLFLQYKERK